MLGSQGLSLDAAHTAQPHVDDRPLAAMMRGFLSSTNHSCRHCCAMPTRCVVATLGTITPHRTAQSVVACAAAGLKEWLLSPTRGAC